MSLSGSELFSLSFSVCGFVLFLFQGVSFGGDGEIRRERERNPQHNFIRGFWLPLPLAHSSAFAPRSNVPSLRILSLEWRVKARAHGSRELGSFWHPATTTLASASRSDVGLQSVPFLFDFGSLVNPESF